MQQEKLKQVQDYEKLVKKAQRSGGQKFWNTQNIQWEAKYVQLKKEYKEVESRKSELLEEKAQCEQKHEGLV